MRFDLTDLRLFLAVAEAGSITRGAGDVGLSLAAASERLKDMELDGGIQLLERGRRGVATTAAGEALAHHARLILRQMAQMRGELSEHASALRSVVRLAANTVAVGEFLPQRLATFMAANPRVDIDLKERQSPEIAKAVTSGFAEIGILSAAVETAGLTLTPFAIDRLVAVLPQGHRLAGSGRLVFADLLDEFFIGLAGGALQEHIDAQAARRGVRLKMRLRLRTFEAICELSGAGAGVGIAPETAALRCARTLPIAFVRLADDWATRHLSLCVRSGEALSPPAEALRAYLAEPS